MKGELAHGPKHLREIASDKEFHLINLVRNFANMFMANYPSNAAAVRARLEVWDETGYKSSTDAISLIDGLLEVVYRKVSVSAL